MLLPFVVFIKSSASLFLKLQLLKYIVVVVVCCYCCCCYTNCIAIECSSVQQQHQQYVCVACEGGGRLCGCLQSTTIGYNDLLAGLARLRTIGFDLFDNIHTIDNLAENNVLVIQPSGLDGTNEELGAVGVGASIGHGQDAGAGVL